MVGVVLVCHSALGLDLLQVAEGIVGKQPRVAVVSVGGNGIEQARERIAEALERVSWGEGGVLILTDMFGGTPSNLCQAFLKEDHVEVVTGVNLPMLIKCFSYRQTKGVGELACLVRDGGQQSIIVSSELLRQRGARKP
jgi:PTS system mannose-specific IIA component